MIRQEAVVIALQTADYMALYGLVVSIEIYGVCLHVC